MKLRQDMFDGDESLKIDWPNAIHQQKQFTIKHNFGSIVIHY